MSANFGSGGEGGQDFELNIASIIDCFTVLIAFMLASASFLSIGIMDAGLSGGGADPRAAEVPDVDFSVKLRKDATFEYDLTGKATDHGKLTAVADLRKKLADARSRFPKLTQVTLIPEDAVEYDQVVQTMAELRKEVPNVLLGTE